MFAAGIATGFLLGQIFKQNRPASDEILKIQRPLYRTFQVSLGFLKDHQPPMMTQTDININAVAWTDLKELSLLLILLEELERNSVQEREAILKDYFNWQHYFQDITDTFAAQQSGTIGSMYTIQYIQRLLELRIAYQTAPSQQQAIFREIRNPRFLCNGREFTLSHGYYEEYLQDNGWTNQFTLQPQSCGKWNEGKDIFHTARMEQKLRDKKQTVKVTWKNSEFHSSEVCENTMPAL